MKRLKTKREFLQDLLDGYEDDVAEDMRKQGRFYTGDVKIHQDTELQLEFQRNLRENDDCFEC